MFGVNRALCIVCIEQWIVGGKISPCFALRMRAILFLVFCPSHFRFTSLDMLLFVLLIVGGKMGTPFRPANACLSVLCTLSLSHLCFITFALLSILFLLLPPYTRNSDPGPQNKFFSPLPSRIHTAYCTPFLFCICSSHLLCSPFFSSPSLKKRPITAVLVIQSRGHNLVGRLAKPGSQGRLFSFFPLIIILPH